MPKALILLTLLLAVTILTALSCYDVQYTTDPSGNSPFINQVVTVQGIVVAERFYTGSSTGNYGFMIGDPEGGPWSGLFIFSPNFAPNRGDLVELTGTIVEYYNWTEMSTVTGYAVLSTGNPLPPASLITSDQLINPATSEQWENVLVAVQNATVTNLPNNYGEFYISNSSSSCQVDDQCFPRSGFSWPAMSIGQNLYRVQGVVDDSFDYYGINPRDLSDLLFNPVNCDLAMTALSVDFWQEWAMPVAINGMVRNNSDLTSGAYDVVISCEGEELNRISFQALAAGLNQSWSCELVFPSPGAKTIVAQAEINSDELPGNNSATRSFIQKPNPAQGIDFGSGDTYLRVPWDFFWKYSLYEAMYYPEEIGHSGYINGISFFNNFETSLIQLNLKLWIGETQLTDLSTAWVPASQLVDVWHDFLAFPIGSNEVYVPFYEPYHYQGGNLVIMAYQTHSWNYVGYDKFQAQVLTGARSRKRFSDAYDPDPNNPPGGIDPTGEVPRVRFYMDPITAVDDPAAPALTWLDCYPNPIRSSATFKTSSPQPGARLDIYNLRGQKVVSLPFSGTEITWDAKDVRGRELPAGIYLARISDGKRSYSRRICLMR